MSAGEQRMQEICIQELVGAITVPDVRDAVRRKLRQRVRRRRFLLVAVPTALALVAWFVWPDKGPFRDPMLRRWIAELTVAESSVDAGGVAALRQRHWESYSRLLDATDERPQLWTELQPGLRQLLSARLRADVRSRLVAVLCHAPDPRVDRVLARQVADHGDELHARTLLLLAARGTAGAERELRRPQRRGPGVAWQTMWLWWRGDRGRRQVLTGLIVSEDALIRAPHLFFAAAVTLARARRPAAWSTCWRVASRYLRGLVVRNAHEALRLASTMYWYYDFLTADEPLPLDDVRRRAERAVRALPSPPNPGLAVERLLERMK